MFQIKCQSRDFSFQLDLSGSVAQSLEELPMEIRKVLVEKVEKSLESFCFTISAVVLVPIISSSFFLKASKMLEKLAKELLDDLHEVENNEIDFIGSSKNSSLEN